jgi:hypothetical protein
VVLVEGGVVWVEVGDVTGDADPVVVGGLGFPPPSDDVTVDVGDESVVPWGVDVDGAVVVELDVWLSVIVLVPVDTDVVVEDVLRQWSSFPFALPWSSHSCPFVFGSVRHAVVLFPCEQLSPGDPGGAGGLSRLAAEAYPTTANIAEAIGRKKILAFTSTPAQSRCIPSSATCRQVRGTRAPGCRSSRSRQSCRTPTAPRLLCDLTLKLRS